MAAELTEIATCEVCENTRLTPVLNLGQQPMCDDLVPIGDSRVCRRYPTEILYCDRCCTAHQRFQIPKHELFPSTYHYRAHLTADVLNGMKQLVDSCEARLGPSAGKTVVDIGCNDGSLLDFFRERGATTAGIEPTDAAHEAAAKGHFVVNAFFDDASAGEILARCGKPDLITFTNVFAHIENLREVLASLMTLMSERTVVVIENHYLGSVLDRNQFDTFYHEHPRTYSCTSFEFIARSLGVELLDVEFPARYGGNIRVFLGKPGVAMPASSAGRQGVAAKEQLFGSRFQRLSANMAHWQRTMKGRISDLVRTHGRLRAKSFPARAAILVSLLGLSEQDLEAVYEKPGSKKIGHYVPGTRIPIRSDDDLFALPDQTKPLLNFAWHIPAEIHAYLASHGYAGPIIDILDAATFDAA